MVLFLLNMLISVTVKTEDVYKRQDLVAVTNGPGSFTGLRIGMSTAKAFAQSCNCPIVQVGTLSALIANFSWLREGIVCAMIDARHARAFSCAVRQGKEILRPDTYSVAEIPVSYTHLDVYKRQSEDNIEENSITEFLPLVA